MRRLFYVAALWLCSCGGSPTVTVSEFIQEGVSGGLCSAAFDCSGADYNACMADAQTAAGTTWTDTTPTKHCTESDVATCRADIHAEPCSAVSAGKLPVSCISCLNE